MKEGPLKHFWETSNGVEIDKQSIDRWAEESIEYANANGYGYVRSGNTIVLAFKHPDEDFIEVFDCQVRRTARIKNDQ